VITKAERAELRSLIRQRFKVLRADIEARRAELSAELEERITAKYAEEDKAWNDAMFLIGQAADEANRKANDVMRGLSFEGYDPSREYQIVTARSITKPTAARTELRRTGIARIDATVKNAYLQLDRQEADVLTKLVQGSLESEEARAFLGEIPTVSSLVPADRLLELEQSLRDDTNPRS
jgi:hypothetical protein